MAKVKINLKVSTKVGTKGKKEFLHAGVQEVDESVAKQLIKDGRAIDPDEVVEIKATNTELEKSIETLKLEVETKDDEIETLKLEVEKLSKPSEDLTGK